jgi:hypothetical protein
MKHPPFPSFAWRNFFYNVEDIDNRLSKNVDALTHLRDFPHLNSIVFDDAPGDAVTPYLSNLDQLKELSLRNCSLTDAGIEHLRGLASLEFLSLSNSPVTGEGLIHLGDSRKLKTLNLEETGFNDKGARCLGRLTQLEELNVFVSPGFSDKALAFLAPLTSLRKLSITATGITGKGLIHLKDMRRMEELILEDIQNTGDAEFVHLEQMDRLRALYFDFSISDDDLIHIGRILSLERLGFDARQITSARLAHLDRLQKLRFLALPDTRIDDVGLSHLSGLAKLETLVLPNCRVLDSGLDCLSQPTSLDLSRVPITQYVVALGTAQPRTRSHEHQHSRAGKARRNAQLGNARTLGLCDR